MSALQVTRSVLLDFSPEVLYTTEATSASPISSANIPSTTHMSFTKAPVSPDLAPLDPIDEPQEFSSEETNIKSQPPQLMTDGADSPPQIHRLILHTSSDIKSPVATGASFQKTVRMTSISPKAQRTPPPVNPSADKPKTPGFRSPTIISNNVAGLPNRERPQETAITLGRYVLDGEQATVFVFVPSAFLHQNGHGTQPPLSFADVVQRIGYC